MSTLTATPASTQTGKPVQLKYGGSLGGSLRITRPDGSRYYLTTSTGDGSKTYTPSKVGAHKAELFTKKLKVLASTSFAVTAIPVPVTPPPPANAVRVARENGTFTLPRAGLVWYGWGNSGWVSRQFASGSVVPCTNATFGDPIPNVVKSCYAVIPAPVLTVVAGLRLVDLAWLA